GRGMRKNPRGFLRLRQNESVLTDAPPRKRNLESFRDSDRRNVLPLPADGRLTASAASMASAMEEGTSADLERCCDHFLRRAAAFYGVPGCGIRVLAARPLRVRERSVTELFGDYHPDSRIIRVWRKTAVRKEITS